MADGPTMDAGKASFVQLIHRYLGGLMDPFVTLLEIQKLMYFMQEADEALRLKYAKGPYGPYAENLMKDDTELFKQFSDNPEFKWLLADTFSQQHMIGQRPPFHEYLSWWPNDHDRRDSNWQLSERMPTAAAGAQADLTNQAEESR